MVPGRAYARIGEARGEGAAPALEIGVRERRLVPHPGGRDGRVSARKLENFVNGAATPNEAFDYTNLIYDPLGNLQQLDYPKCIHAACTAPTPRTVVNTYSEGLLTAVGIPGNAGYYASSITYHPNLQVNQVVHGNGLTDTQANDPNAMRRPGSITVTTSGGTTRWSTGAYSFDGVGNVKAIGAHTFGYDKVSRLRSANLYLEPTSSTTPVAQTFAYDAFGNLQSIAGNASRNTPTSSSTNRLTGGTYDDAGNLTAWNGNLYEYDPLHMMSRYKTPTDEWVYLYTADDERAWSYKIGGTESRWTLRGLGGQFLRQYLANGWAVETDSIYRGGLLLAAETPQGVRHHHLDHLGTPRLISDSLGQQKAYHIYYPYGEEATAFNQDTIRTKFTGHERDLANPGGPGDDLDYMHARHCSPVTGRFLSVDPVQGRLRFPQTWNRYSYAVGNPLKYIDPDGRSIWRTIFRVIRHSPEGKRRVTAQIREISKKKAVERTKQALDKIDSRQRSQGAKRAVRAETDEARDALAKELSTNKKSRGPEKSGGKDNPKYPKHSNPDEGPYEDVHVESEQSLLGVMFAPATSGVSESGEAEPGELLSAAAWDVVSTLDPTGLSDAISWSFDIE